jgi:4'-phosphopantetheinyl transferase
MSVSSSQHSAASASTADAVPQDPAPQPSVHWTVAEGLDAAAIRLLTAELSEDEARQARAFHFDRDRTTYIAAHAMLRRVLRDALGGAEPHLVRNPLGRPELAPPPGGGPALSFNLTHTRGFAACAILHGAAVGIDAEDIRRPIDIAEVAGRWFAPPERHLLERSQPAHRAEMFYRIWTLKEAILKTTGHGLRIEPQFFAVDPERGRALIPEGLGIPTRWRLAECAPLPHLRLALAVPGQGPLTPRLSRIDLGRAQAESG